MTTLSTPVGWSRVNDYAIERVDFRITKAFIFTAPRYSVWIKSDTWERPRHVAFNNLESAIDLVDFLSKDK